MNTFTRCVTSALRHLYDFRDLAKHPLGQLLGLGRYSPNARAQQLRSMLLDAIGAMRPERGVPTDAPDWRAYEILRLRYIEGLTADETMRRLCLQKSQFFADQQGAIQMVADRLSEQSNAGLGPGASPADRETGSGEELVRTEAERLWNDADSEDIDVGDLLGELGHILTLAAESQHVGLSIRPSAPRIVVVAHRVPLRQAILHVASYALNLCPHGSVQIAPYADANRIGIQIRAQSSDIDYRSQARSSDQQLRLELAKQLLTNMEARLFESRHKDSWEALLTWDQAPSPVLLVVDDNQGFVDLFRRYLVGHHWHVVGASSDTDLPALIEQVRPAVIIMDVLMPQRDGWDLMVSLRAEQSTRDIPIIVCSVLREAQIALSLGATSYLAKPVTEQALLEALSPWSDLSPPRR